MTAALALASAEGDLDDGALGTCLKGIEAGRIEGQAKLSEKDDHAQE